MKKSLSVILCSRFLIIAQGFKRFKQASSNEYKRRSVLIITSLMVLVLSVSGAIALDQNQEHTVNVLRANLSNGLRVVIVRNPLAPVATTVMNYLVGSNEAPEKFPGTAHALEHMMFRGSPGLSAGQLANITAAMGGMFDADTQQEVTQYFFTVPSEDLDTVLHIEAARMRGIVESEKLWEQERSAIEQEVAQDLSSPEYVFYTQILSTLFKGTPYVHDALGTRPSFEKTTGAMLQEFHKTWYVPNNAILVVVGDVDPDAVLVKIRTLFEGIPGKKNPVRSEIQPQEITSSVTLNLPTDMPYGMVAIAFRIPGYESPDNTAVQVLAEVLSNQRSNLYGLVVEGKALNAGFSINLFQKAGLGFAAAAFPVGGDAQTLLKSLRTVLSEYITNGFPADLVAAAKRYAITDMELQKNSVSGLAMAWSQALAIEGRQSPEESVKAIQQVSVEGVDRVARKFLDLDHTVSAILTPQSSGAPVAAKGYGGRESFSLSHSKGINLPEWASKSLTRLSIPESGLNPITTILPNGLKLILQPESISDTVSVYGFIRNNPALQVSQGKEGVDDLLDQLFSFGTTTLDRISFQKALDDIGAYASAGTRFSLRVLTERFEQGVQLLADSELRPALPGDAFSVIRRQTAEALSGQLKSPEHLAGRALKTALFPKDDPALRQATPLTVNSLTLEDLKTYYESVFRPDMTTIVVIGNIATEKARSIIEKYFSVWSAKGPKPETFLPLVPLNKPSTAAVPNTSRIQDKVTLAETIGIDRSHPDYYALQLGNHVLGGGFYATRLYQDLREKTGLVYYVSSSFDVGKTRSIYVVDFACDPINVSKAHAIVDQNLLDLQSVPVSEEELKQAKTMLLREIPLAESSVGNIAQGFIARINLDLPLNEPVVAAHRYVSLTAEQVKAVFERWLRPLDLVQVTEGPPPL